MFGQSPPYTSAVEATTGIGENVDALVLSQLLQQLDQQEQEARRRLEEQEARHQLEREILVRRQLAHSVGLPVVLPPAAAEAAARGSHFIMAHGIPQEALEEYLMETTYHELQRDQELRLAGRMTTLSSRGPRGLLGGSILPQDLLQSYIASESSSLAGAPYGGIHRTASSDSQEGKNLPTHSILQLLEIQQANEAQVQPGYLITEELLRRIAFSTSSTTPQSRSAESASRSGMATSNKSKRPKDPPDYRPSSHFRQWDAAKQQRQSPRKKRKVTYYQDDDSTDSSSSGSDSIGNQADGLEDAKQSSLSPPPPPPPRACLDMNKLKHRGKGKSIMDVVLGKLSKRYTTDKEEEKSPASSPQENAPEDTASTTSSPPVDEEEVIPERRRSKRRQSR